MAIGERIYALRGERDYSQTELAEMIGVSKQTLYKYENNIVTNVPSDKVEALAAALRTTPAYLMGWDEDPSAAFGNITGLREFTVPIIGTVACGVPKYAEEEFHGFTSVRNDCHVDFCLIASGDSMIGAGIHDGDFVLFEKCDIVNNGDIACVVIDDEATLKRFYYHRDKNVLILRAENPAYEDLVYTGEDLDHITVLGRAVIVQSLVR